VRVRTGQSLSQIRFSLGEAVLTDAELRAEYEKEPLLFRDDGEPIPVDRVRFDDGLCMGIALSQDSSITGPIGYVARNYTGVVDVGLEGAHDVEPFFAEIPPPSSGHYIVEPEEFYIFASKESIHVPRHLAAEMLAYDVGIGELRTNYAGFFDPGFGGDSGTRAVLEVRPHDVPFLIEDGQVFFRLRFLRTLALPDVCYGDASLSSHYQGQALKLSKHFR